MKQITIEVLYDDEAEVASYISALERVNEYNEFGVTLLPHIGTETFSEDDYNHRVDKTL
jgi:hypothetical protein